MAAILRGLAVWLPVLAAGQALAECPATREDAAQGIVVSWMDGSKGRIVRSEDGRVIHTRTADGYDWLNEFASIHGVYPVSFSDRPVDGTVEDGPGWLVTYSEEVWPEPVAGLAWTTLAKKAFDFGAGEPFEAVLTVQAGEAGMLAIGSCLYESLTVDASVQDEGATFVYRERLDYLPDLGIALLREVREEQIGATVPAVPRRFTYTEIGVDGSAGGAVAEAASLRCPSSPDDLDAGIAISFSEGVTSVLTRDAEGLIVERTEYNDGSGLGLHSRSRFGFALVELAETLDGKFIDGTLETYEYPTMGLDVFEAPETEARAFGTLRITTLPDGERLEEEIHYRMRFFEDRDWGGCTYRVLPVHVSHLESDDSTVEVYEYIPPLGTAILTAILDGDTPIMESPPLGISTIKTAN